MIAKTYSKEYLAWLRSREGVAPYPWKTPMYRVFWSNFDYFSQEQFFTVGAAIEYGKSKGFEFQVYNSADRMMASWRQFGGLRYW